MPFGAIAGAIGGIASIFGGNASADAADAASKRQAATAQQGIDFQRQVLQQIQQYLTPYIGAGQQGLAQLQDLTRAGAGQGVFQDPRAGAGAGTPPSQAFNFQGPTSGMFGQDPLSAIFGGSLGADPNTKMLSGQLGATPNSALMGGVFGKNPNDLTVGDFHHSPGYAAATQGGLEAIRNSASRTGGAVAGNALKALTGFGTQAANQDWQSYLDSYGKNFFNTANQYGSNFSNLASQYGNNFSNLGGLYGNQYANMANIYGNEADRYSTDYYKNVGINSGLNSDLFNRLFQIAGTGQNAATGGGALANNAASGIANSLTGLGNAQAAGIVGSNNALQGGISSGLTSILGGNALSGGGSGSSGGSGGLGALLANLFSGGGSSSNSAMQSYGVFPGANNPYTSYGGGDGTSGFY